MTNDIDDQADFKEPDEFFLKRRLIADFEAFDRIMQRMGGEPPVPGDEMPE